jgi:hypothetical protein
MGEVGTRELAFAATPGSSVPCALKGGAQIAPGRCVEWQVENDCHCEFALVSLRHVEEALKAPIREAGPVETIAEAKAQRLKQLDEVRGLIARAEKLEREKPAAPAKEQPMGVSYSKGRTCNRGVCKNPVADTSKTETCTPCKQGYAPGSEASIAKAPRTAKADAVFPTATRAARAPDAVHLGTPSGNPSCKVKDPAARVTSNPELVTCTQSGCAVRALVQAERRGVLMPIEAARRMLAECRSVDPAKQIRDQAEAVRAYLRQQRASSEAQNDAAEIKLRAERRLGELLEPDKEKRGGAKSQRASLPEASAGRSRPGGRTSLAYPGTSSRVHSPRPARRAGRSRALACAASTSRRSSARRASRSSPESPRATSRCRSGETAERYPVIYADPPWEYDRGSTTPNRQIENQYPTMSLDQVCALPVPKLATDNAILFMWATNPLLPEALQVLKAWGFTYKSNFSWDKERTGHRLLGAEPARAPAHRDAGGCRRCRPRRAS